MTWYFTFSGQCKAKTKAGTPCRQRSIYPNGYCRLHGGKVTKKFMDSYKARILKQERRRDERLRKRFGDWPKPPDDDSQ